MNRTLIIVKPHAVERGLVGTFLERFEKMRLNLEAVKVLRESAEFWTRFYPSHDEWCKNVGSKTLENCSRFGISVKEHLGTDEAEAIGRLVKGWLVDHMTSGPSVAAIISGNEATTKVRLACGSTLPNMAAPGTIRFDYSTDSPILANLEKRPVYNLIHASDPSETREGVSAAEYEIGMVFGA